MRRYFPARHYLPASLTAAVLAVVCAWGGNYWHLAFIPSVLFFASSAALYFLATRPAIEVSDTGITVGEDSIRWSEIERIEATGWTSPLVLRLWLRGGGRRSLIHPGDMASSELLLRHLRHLAREVRIEAPLPARARGGDEPLRLDPRATQRPRYRLLRPDDEEEVERLYQRLRVAGRLDTKTARDDRYD